MIPNKILLEMKLELDQFKTTTQRDSTNFFDWLGDWGGLQQALGIGIGIISQYFSEKYFNKSIAEKLFIRQKSSKKLKRYEA